MKMPNLVAAVYADRFYALIFSPPLFCSRTVSSTKSFIMLRLPHVLTPCQCGKVFHLSRLQGYIVIKWHRTALYINETNHFVIDRHPVDINFVI